MGRTSSQRGRGGHQRQTAHLEEDWKRVRAASPGGFPRHGRGDRLSRGLGEAQWRHPAGCRSASHWRLQRSRSGRRPGTLHRGGGTALGRAQDVGRSRPESQVAVALCSRAIGAPGCRGTVLCPSRPHSAVHRMERWEWGGSTASLAAHTRSRRGRSRARAARPAGHRIGALRQGRVTQMPSPYTLDFEKPLQELERQIEDLKRIGTERQIDIDGELEGLEGKLVSLRAEIYRSLTPLQRVMVARHPRRPYTLDYLSTIFTDFIELHGDRLYMDDPAIVGGWARLAGVSVMVIGHQKGRDTKENLKRNFGMPHPEGYRKALRLMKLAAKFGAGVITLIDTPGAYPGLGAEERGQSEALARNILEMSSLPTPSVAVVIGEGGSGGALALGVADRVLKLKKLRPEKLVRRRAEKYGAMGVYSEA